MVISVLIRSDIQIEDFPTYSIGGEGLFPFDNACAAAPLSVSLVWGSLKLIGPTATLQWTMIRFCIQRLSAFPQFLSFQSLGPSVPCTLDCGLPLVPSLHIP
jgi:hypothetical protein